jgi:hypothetical protein
VEEIDTVLETLSYKGGNGKKEKDFATAYTAHSE